MPGVGGDKKEDEGLTREELQEQERLRYKNWLSWDDGGWHCYSLVIVGSKERVNNCYAVIVVLGKLGNKKKSVLYLEDYYGIIPIELLHHTFYYEIRNTQDKVFVQLFYLKAPSATFFHSDGVTNNREAAINGTLISISCTCKFVILHTIYNIGR